MSDLFEGLDLDLSQVTPGKILEIQHNSDALIRDLVLNDGRIDVLAEFVLGYKPRPFHLEMMEWQSSCKEGMLLAWRGAAKSTYCNITRCIFEILRNPNVRILLASDAIGQSSGFLRAIRSHFESNEKLRRIFGDWVRGSKIWSENQILVAKRTTHAAEPTIMCTGIGTRLPSKHFDIIICDDLVTSDNAITEGQRNKVRDYFYQTLFPTLDPKNGRLWILGTRWHEEDLYDWMGKEDYKDTTLVMGVLDENDVSRWEDQFPTETMHRIRKANLNAFELQYMCRSGVGVGGIFSEDHFLYYDGLPGDCFKWQSVDLAIGQKAVNDFFAHVTFAMQKKTKIPFLIEYRKDKLQFPAQVKFVIKQYDKHKDAIRVVTEANAYQLALLQQIKADRPDIPVVGRYTLKDKVARAQQLAIFFTSNPLHVKRGHHEFIRLLCGFPNVHGSKDVFDALEIGLGQAIKGSRKKRRNEPGVL